MPATLTCAMPYACQPAHLASNLAACAACVAPRRATPKRQCAGPAGYAHARVRPPASPHVCAMLGRQPWLCARATAGRLRCLRAALGRPTPTSPSLRAVRGRQTWRNITLRHMLSTYAGDIYWHVPMCQTAGLCSPSHHPKARLPVLGLLASFPYSDFKKKKNKRTLVFRFREPPRPHQATEPVPQAGIHHSPFPASPHANKHLPKTNTCYNPLIHHNQRSSPCRSRKPAWPTSPTSAKSY